MTFTKVTNTGIGSTGTVLLQNLDVIGIATAGFGVSTVDVFTTGITTFANATDSTSSTTGSVIVSGGVGIAGSLNVGGSVSVGGTLTYEDVTNIDSVGIITARSNILVGSGITLSPDGDVFTTGVSTFSSNIKVGSGITLSPDGDVFTTGVSTFSSNVNIGVGTTGFVSITPDAAIKLQVRGTSGQDVLMINTQSVAGDGDTFANIRGDNRSGIRIRGGGSYDGGAIELAGGLRDSEPGIIKFETGTGSSVDERVRITSAGHVGIGTSGNTRLHVYHPTTNTVAKFESGDAGAGFVLTDPTCTTRLEQTGATFKIDVDSNSETTGEVISFQMSGSEKLRINSDGYVTGNINVPAWFGQQDTAHSVANATWTTVVNLGNEVTNPSMNNGGWDESAGTFTVQDGQAGTYYVFGQAGIDDIQGDDIVRVGISKNNANPAFFGECRSFVGEANQIYQAYIAMVITVAVGDTIRLKVYHNEGTSEVTEQNRCYFGGYRIAT